MLGFDRVDDEAVLRNAHHPEHRSGMREGFWIGFIVVVVGGGFFGMVEVNWLPEFAKYTLVGILAAAASFSVIYWIGDASRRQQIKANREYREHMDVAKAKQLKEAKETGAFDRWEK